MLVHLLFPDLKGKYKPLNLNQHAEEDTINWYSNSDHHNDLLNPYLCELWVNKLHKLYGCEYSFGGWLEDRSVLWRGHYHQRGHTIHLGVDYNVPAGTSVHAPFDSEVVHSYCDCDVDGGWVGRLMFASDEGFYIMGHLCRNELPRKGTKFKQGEFIERIASYPENGNWYPHLHLQRISAPCLSRFLDWDKIDGYSNMYDGIENDYPNPGDWKF
jgi:hypothetical protein